MGTYTKGTALVNPKNTVNLTNPGGDSKPASTAGANNETAYPGGPFQVVKFSESTERKARKKTTKPHGIPVNGVTEVEYGRGATMKVPARPTGNQKKKDCHEDGRSMTIESPEIRVSVESPDRFEPVSITQSPQSMRVLIRPVHVSQEILYTIVRVTSIDPDRQAVVGDLPAIFRKIHISTNASRVLMEGETRTLRLLLLNSTNQTS
ncbi:uncharacterized protein BDV17DRAFT_165977 [Aspergillus undulatus]|uniref:uncharacterized protein n=1 Tax=Aspergillus undulatus TaxID=1810928 RepID=UPI003CCD2F25